MDGLLRHEPHQRQDVPGRPPGRRAGNLVLHLSRLQEQHPGDVQARHEGPLPRAKEVPSERPAQALSATPRDGSSALRRPGTLARSRLAREGRAQDAGGSRTARGQANHAPCAGRATATAGGARPALLRHARRRGAHRTRDGTRAAIGDRRGDPKRARQAPAAQRTARGAALALPARRHRLRCGCEARNPRGRHGARQDDSGCGRRRAFGARSRRRQGARGLPCFAQVSVAKRDPSLLATKRDARRGQRQGPRESLRRGHVLHGLQLRAGAQGHPSHRANAVGPHRPRRRPAHQELGGENKPRHEGIGLALRPGAHGHTAREPPRRPALRRRVRRPSQTGPAVSVLSSAPQARRGRQARRLQEPRRAARAPSADSSASDARIRATRAAIAHDRDRPHRSHGAAKGVARLPHEDRGADRAQAVPDRDGSAAVADGAPNVPYGSQRDVPGRQGRPRMVYEARTSRRALRGHRSRARSEGSPLLRMDHDARSHRASPREAQARVRAVGRERTSEAAGRARRAVPVGPDDAVLSLDERGKHRPQPPGRQHDHQRGSAVEPGRPRAADRACTPDGAGAQRDRVRLDNGGHAGGEPAFYALGEARSRLGRPRRRIAGDGGRRAHGRRGAQAAAGGPARRQAGGARRPGGAGADGARAERAAGRGGSDAAARGRGVRPQARANGTEGADGARGGPRCQGSRGRRRTHPIVAGVAFGRPGRSARARVRRPARRVCKP